MIDEKTIFRFIIPTVLIFLLIFNPPIFSFLSFTILILGILFIYCLLNIKELIAIITTNASYKKFLKNIIIFIYYIVIVGLFRGFFGNDSIASIIINIIRDSQTWCFLIISSFGLLLIFYKYKMTFNEMLSVYVFSGIIQATLGIGCFLFPAVKNSLNTVMIKNSRSKRISYSVYYTMAYRNYGFAATLFDIFGYAMSCLSSIALQLGLSNAVYYLFFYMIAFVAIINARTSVLLISVILLIALLMFHNVSFESKKVKRFSFVFFIVSTVFVVIYLFIMISNSNTEGAAWLSLGIEDLTNFFFNRKDTGTVAGLKEMLFLPSSIIDQLFGVGLTPDLAIGHNSDVGYIQNIWKYGFIGSFLLYKIYIDLFMSVIKQNVGLNKILIVSLFVTFFVYLLKLNPIGYTYASVIVMPVVLYSVFNYNVKEEKYEK